LAVLVVATPCPLILAAPIALVSGGSRAARVGIVVKGAGVIEQLGRVRTVLLDTVDRIDRVAEAVRIGRRSLSIAQESVLAGMGLSVAAMVAAALGHIPPVAGALLQEGIDVAVILNALRALRG
jgi:cation transport ATPase